MSFALASSLTTALHTICFALSAYLSSRGGGIRRRVGGGGALKIPEGGKGLVVIDVGGGDGGDHGGLAVAPEVLAEQPGEDRVSVRYEVGLFRFLALGGLKLIGELGIGDESDFGDFTYRLHVRQKF
jgi:hypothetical protein